MRQLYVASVALIATLVSAAENSETFIERSQGRARAVLDRAVDALGGAETLRSIEAVRVRMSGQIWPRLQSPTVTPPFETGTQEETLLVDFKNNVMVRELRTTGAGFEGNNTFVIKSGAGTTYDHRARTATPIPRCLCGIPALFAPGRRIELRIVQPSPAQCGRNLRRHQERGSPRYHDEYATINR